MHKIPEPDKFLMKPTAICAPVETGTARENANKPLLRNIGQLGCDMLAREFQKFPECDETLFVCIHLVEHFSSRGYIPAVRCQAEETWSDRGNIHQLVKLLEGHCSLALCVCLDELRQKVVVQHN